MNGWLELKEFEPTRVESGRLSMDEGMWLHRRFGKQLKVDFPGPATEGCWRLTPKGWVGVIPMGKRGGIRISPRFPVQNLFLMLGIACRFGGVCIMDGRIRADNAEGWVDRLIGWLADRVAERIRRGPVQEFRTEENTLPVVRGKLLTEKWIARPHPDRIPCRFRVIDADCDDNRLLLWTLHRVLRARLPLQSETTANVTRAYRMLSRFVTLRPVNVHVRNAKAYHPRYGEYEGLHTLCRLVLEGLLPGHGCGTGEAIPFLVDMSRLFEMFVAEWLKMSAPDQLEIRSQERVRPAGTGRIRFRADLVAVDRRTGRPVSVMDTKYKSVQSLSARDVAQVVAYALSLGTREAVLVTPGGGEELDEEIGGIRVRALVFDVAQDPEAAGKAFLRAWLEGGSRATMRRSSHQTGA
ncbi:McrC family protein [Staphylospora marina]|uniref:McrC family protein n=1 Tax=Staphylospora marina TaxID=2490858 RepID=UPI000F5C14B9|nr:hypothetical protein [Staphylospora marina]